jgi:predicted amidohydrolase
MHAQSEIVHVAQWPAVKDLHQLASRHYAFEGQCFVVAAGCVLTRRDVIEGFHSLGRSGSQAIQLLEAMPGEEEDFYLTGGSAVIGPDSRYVAGPVFDQSDVIIAGIDPGRITEGHLVLDTEGHYSRPDVFHLEVNDRPQTNVTFALQGE